MKFIVLLTLIFSGLQASPFKYVVSIVDLEKFDVNVANDFGKGHLCTGVIIDSRHVVTAENCIHGSSQRIAIVAGTPMLTRKQLTTQIANVLKLSGTGKMGYVIMTLSDELNLDSKYAQSIKMYPKENTLETGQVCNLVGWGWRKVGKKCQFVTMLQNINMTVVKQSLCNEKLFPIRKTFCVMDVHDQVAYSGCPVVSGRPFICGNELVGIEMFTRRCNGVQEATYIYDAHFLDISHEPPIGELDTSQESSGQEN